MERPDPKTLHLVRADYQKSAKVVAAEDQWWEAKGLSLESACRRAAESILPDGKMDSHQRRQGRDFMRRFADKVAAAAPRFAKARDFDELLGMMSNLVSSYEGAGELVAYDVADRIGLHLGKTPQVVYLHAGARAGAKRLGLGRGVRFIEMGELPPPLNSLRPREAEDMLCIYESMLLMSPDECRRALEKRRNSCGPGESNRVC